MAQWSRWRQFALGALSWTEAAFWDCSWAGFAEAWAGYRRFVLGVDPDAEPLSRAEAASLDRAVAAWQRTGEWKGQRDG